ncbi:MAG: phage tail sheath subtilisin-like domain-containing protein [Planctomycetota bacterium]
MPVTVSYPGLYLEELASNARSIVAAPTSVAVFVGYTHPFKTLVFDKPIRLFSFTDYERAFGGVYVSSILDANVAHAVNLFFQNGGSDAYVVGLRPKYQVPGVTPAVVNIAAPTSTLTTTGTGTGIVFTGLEPTDDPGIALSVTLSNIVASTSGGALDTADYVISYGTKIETFRGVKLGTAGFDQSINAISTLIRVGPGTGGYGTAFVAATTVTITLTQTVPTSVPAGLTTTFSAADFTGVFQTEKPLDKVDVFNLLLVPGISHSGILSAALAFAERKQAFVIMDPPIGASPDSNSSASVKTQFLTLPKSTNGAIYFPYLKSSHPVSGSTVELPPGGFVAGIFARTDTRRGVWKAPAGVEAIVNNTTGVVDSGLMNDPQQGVLNLAGINCLRTFPGIGTVVYGARTLVSENVAFQQNKYVPVRRMTLFIEQTLLQNLKWVVFEPNDVPLWLAIRTTIDNFMLSLFNQGALQGSKPSQAFQVKCDGSTTTQDDINNGIVNIIVAFAPLKPAEFVIIKIAHLAGQTQS